MGVLRHVAMCIVTAAQNYAGGGVVSKVQKLNPRAQICKICRMSGVSKCIGFHTGSTQGIVQTYVFVGCLQSKVCKKLQLLSFVRGQARQIYSLLTFQKN